MIRWHYLPHNSAEGEHGVCPTCGKVLDEQAVEEWLAQMTKDDDRFANPPRNEGVLNYELGSCFTTKAQN